MAAADTHIDNRQFEVASYHDEQAHSTGLEMDSKTVGRLVDAPLRTSRPGVFAIGNVLHPVDTADIAALDGRHVQEHAAHPHLAWARQMGFVNHFYFYLWLRHEVARCEWLREGGRLMPET